MLPATPATVQATPIDARWVVSGLRMRVLVPLALGLIILFATLTTMILLARARQSEQDLAQRAASVQTRVQERIDSEARTMRSLLELLMLDQQLVAAMRARDRGALLALAAPVFDTLRVRNKVSHMYFILPDRTVLLRVHAPEDYGDRIGRTSLLRAERTGEPAWLNEPGPRGTFTLRVVYPWTVRGQLIGYMELGIELEDLLDGLKGTLGADLFVAIDKSRLDFKNWQAAQDHGAHRMDWDEFPQTVLITRTTEKLPPELRAFLSGQAATTSKRTFEARQGGRIQQVISERFQLGGQDVGRMLVMSDITDGVAERRRAVLTLAALSLLIGGALTAFFYVLLGKVQQDVAARTARLGEARASLAEEHLDRRRAERELVSQHERNEMLEARSRMLDKLADATQTAQAALRDNEEITRKLREMQSELVATARQAGRAEIATNVLHNVGNVLNSVNTSAGLIGSTLRRSRLTGLARALQLLEQHAGDVGDFLTRDAKGKLLPGYLAAAGQALASEHQGMTQELERLMKSLDHIEEIVATQQSHAVAGHVIEPVMPAELAENALRMQSAALIRHNVQVVREFGAVPRVPLDRGRVLQILVNLICNATAAMGGLATDARRLTVRIEMATPSRLRFAVSDVGEGIPQENLTRIFAHGFTTRADGHGFGLHSSALAASEVGGTLTVHSDGPGRGATFTLELPLPARTE